MSVNVTWKSPPAGSAITSVNHGSGNNGDTLTAVEIGISHDGTNPITNCKFWIGEYSGTYTGDANATVDLAEVLAWGEDATTSGFGGAQINMNQISAYPSADWPTYLIRQPNYGSAFYPNIGDSAANGVTLKATMDASMLSDGIIPASIEAKFKARIQIPINTSTPGVRQFDQKLRYTFTS